MQRVSSDKSCEPEPAGGVIMSQKQTEEHENSGKSSNLVLDRHQRPFSFGRAKLDRKKRYDNRNNRRAEPNLSAEDF
jgi:hypothetical protein